MRPIGLQDMFGDQIHNGHICAVRYVWNSYVGVVRFIDFAFRLSLHETSLRFAGVASTHPIESKNTYQILGHIDPTHKDYNQDVIRWLYSEDGECPIKIEIYKDFNIP